MVSSILPKDNTPVITLFISRLKSRVLKLSFLSLKMMVKSGLEFILKLTEPLQSCCCPVEKCLPRMAELAWQLCRYLWRGFVNFKINSIPLFTIISKLKNDNFMTRDFSPLIEWVLTGVESNGMCLQSRSKNFKPVWRWAPFDEASLTDAEYKWLSTTSWPLLCRL